MNHGRIPNLQSTCFSLPTKLSMISCTQENQQTNKLLQFEDEAILTFKAYDVIICKTACLFKVA